MMGGLSDSIVTGHTLACLTMFDTRWRTLATLIHDGHTLGITITPYPITPQCNANDQFENAMSCYRISHEDSMTLQRLPHCVFRRRRCYLRSMPDHNENDKPHLIMQTDALSQE